jgi:hypothetical protein
MSTFQKNAFSVLLIIILSAVIYANTFDVPFYFDDNHAIENNHAISQFDIKRIFFSSPRPVLDVTFAVNYYFGKLNVFGYHLVNLLLHMINGVMLYFIVLRTINLMSGDHTRGIKVPLYTSLIFVAHPVQTQAVTYIVSRSSVLATFFYLLSLLLFIYAFRQGEKHEGKRTETSGNMPSTLYYRLFITGAFVSCCLAMGTKPIAATLPLILILFDFYFISNGKWRVLKSHYRIHLLMFVTISIAAYLNVYGLKEFVSFDYIQSGPVSVAAAPGALKQLGPVPVREPAITSFQYFLTQLHVIPYYIKLLFLPFNLNLDYDWPITRNIDLLTIMYFVLICTIIGIALKLLIANVIVQHYMVFCDPVGNIELYSAL